MLPTQLIILNCPAAYTVLLTVSLTTSCLCGLNPLCLTLHILIYSVAHYISSGTDMDYFFNNQEVSYAGDHFLHSHDLNV